MALKHALKDALAAHRARHAPTGFGFALAETPEQLNTAVWDELTRGASAFMRRPYLRALAAHPPKNLSPRAALIFKGGKPVAALCAQVVDVTGDRLGAKALKDLKIRLIVGGNLLSWGQHAVALAPGIEPREAWPGIAEALYRIRRAEKLSGRADFSMVKDVSEHDAPGIEALTPFSYKSMETDPNMVLDLDPSWKTFQDYLASMHSKYRKGALKIVRDIETAGCTVESIVVADRAEEIFALYRQVHEAAKVRPATIDPGYIPALQSELGDDFRCAGVLQGGRLLGFVTTLRDGETAVGYYIGYERSTKGELPVYFRLLQRVVEDSIALGCRRISLGRTALEPKAKLGARPVPTRVWLRHSQPLLNAAVSGLLGAVPHDEAPERNPFKAPAEAV